MLVSIIINKKKNKKRRLVVILAALFPQLVLSGYFGSFQGSFLKSYKKYGTYVEDSARSLRTFSFLFCIL
jgi:hypothetical protein